MNKAKCDSQLCKRLSGIHSWFCWAPPKGLDCFSGSALCSTQSFSSKPWRIPTPYCCSTLGGHPLILASPKCGGLLFKMDCSFTISLSWALLISQASTSLYDPWNPEPSLLLRLHLRQWPLLTSHSTNPHLLSMTPACLQNEYKLGDSNTSTFSCQHKVHLGCLWDTAYVCWLSGNTLWKISLLGCLFCFHHCWFLRSG